MKITINIKNVNGIEPKYTKDEIKDALTNVNWIPSSENPYYHHACAKRQDIRNMLAHGNIKIEYELSRDECIELLNIKELLDICVQYGFMERDIAELATWTKAGLEDYIHRKMNLVRIDWLEVWDQMRKIASQRRQNDI